MGHRAFITRAEQSMTLYDSLILDINWIYPKPEGWASNGYYSYHFSLIEAANQLPQVLEIHKSRIQLILEEKAQK